MNKAAKKNDIKALPFLLSKYASPYWLKILLLLVLSLLAAFMLPMTALVLAPALHIITLASTAPASGLSDLSLNNLGPTMLSILQLDAGEPWNIILIVIVSYVVVSVSYAALNFCAYLMAMHVRTHVARDIVVDLFQHVLSLPLSFFQHRRSGDIMSRFTEDARGTGYALDSIIRGVLQSFIQVLISIALLVKTEPILAVAAFFFGAGHFVITRLLAERLKKRMVAQNTALGDLSSVLQEALTAIRVIKSFAAELFELKRFTAEAEKHRSMSMQYALAKHIEEPLRFAADAVAVSLVLLLTFQAMQAGRLSLEGFGLFIILSRQVISPISLLSTHVLAISGMLGSAERLIEFFNISSTLPEGSCRAEEMTGALIIRNVSFRYAGKKEVLRQINLTIRKGETVAVVGPSGSGKSTLADLMLRFYDPDQGDILLDGRDIRSLQQESYRKLFGVVPQECQLFNASLRDNILYGRDCNEKLLEQSIAVANASSFISELPNGLDTALGERGLRLSGGQRQRIAIARAVYGCPSILILDEATSSLDTESEALVQGAINEVVKAKTALVIAHRLSTVRHADKIVVLNRGMVEVEGTHDELMKRSVTYKNLCAAQLVQ